MGIQTNVTEDIHGIDIEAAYIVIGAPSVSHNSFTYSYQIFVNQQARIDGKKAINSGLGRMNYDSESVSQYNLNQVYSALYEHIKTLPEFEGKVIIDIL